jgi:membrane-associated phospholipid phosphatase
VLIAAARIVAGAHYLSDVTFAAALGIACAILTCNAIGCHRRDTS